MTDRIESIRAWAEGGFGVPAHLGADEAFEQAARRAIRDLLAELKKRPEVWTCGRGHLGAIPAGTAPFDHPACPSCEVDRLHSWAGLMSVLVEHYPAEVFDGSSDPGARIVTLTRAVDELRATVAAVAAVVAVDDDARSPEGRAALLAERVRASLEHRESGADQGWGYADTVERDAARDRADRDAVIERLRGLLRDLHGAHQAFEEADAALARAMFDIETAEDAESGPFEEVEQARIAAEKRLADAWEAAERECASGTGKSGRG